MNQTRNFRCLLVSLLAFLQIYCASGQIRLAAIGGIQSTDLIQKNSIPGFDTSDGKYYSPNTGFELGFLAEIPLNKSFFIQPGIIFSTKGNQYERSYDTSVTQNDTLYDQHTLNLSYVEIPLYLTWKLGLSKNGNNHFFLSAGPYFAFINGASQSYQNRYKQYNATKYTYNSGTEDLPVGTGVGSYKTFDLGITAKAGFELGNVLISAYYSRGITSAYTAAYSSSFHNQVIGGSIGIWLNKIKPLPVAKIDTDHDGTPDTEDSCINIPGPPRLHGCPVPDGDHDGINDEEDSCKTVAGFPDYHGCPIPDRDNDGVNDEMDRCPDIAGPANNQGCPVVQAAIIKRAQIVAANVTFRTNSTDLLKSSYPALRELSDSLRTNPDLDLLIEGYTDNIGKPAYNEQLSLHRAEAVKKALLNMGIPEQRIHVKGFGETNPVADNRTEKGRAENRRVVFVFQLKNR